ncbi:MAG: RidA family protein [Proteobacteria bacterium]|nr:RidA family protein [Pseudomonadota bacterium]
MARTVVATTDAPAAIGPYSQAIIAGDYVFTAGQIGLDPATGTMREGVVAQAEQVFSNLEAVLAAAGCTLADVVKTTVFVADMNDYATVNGVYDSHFAAPYPARSAVEAARLPKDARVEIELVAYRPA